MNDKNICEINRCPIEFKKKMISQRKNFLCEQCKKNYITLLLEELNEICKNRCIYQVGGRHD